MLNTYQFKPDPLEGQTQYRLKEAMTLRGFTGTSDRVVKLFEIEKGSMCYEVHSNYNRDGEITVRFPIQDGLKEYDQHTGKLLPASYAPLLGGCNVDEMFDSMWVHEAPASGW